MARGRDRRKVALGADAGIRGERLGRGLFGDVLSVEDDLTEGDVASGENDKSSSGLGSRLLTLWIGGVLLDTILVLQSSNGGVFLNIVFPILVHRIRGLPTNDGLAFFVVAGDATPIVDLVGSVVVVPRGTDDAGSANLDTRLEHF